MKLPRAILFDHDGVLAQSEPLHWNAWQELCAEIGVPYVESELRRHIGKTGPEVIAALLEKHQAGSAKNHDLHALAFRKNGFYLKGLGAGLRPYPAVRELLAWLREKNIPAAVVSNAKRRELDAGLQAMGLMDFFALTVSRDDVPRFKPDPTPYLHACAQLGIAPEEALAIEDSPPGIEAALVGGIPAVAVLTTFSREVMSSPVPGRPDLRPVAIVESIAEFFSVLRALR